jgi:uncharacterized membrane protein YhaH (DUF805 family)
MTPGAAIRNGMTRYAVFRGRASRSEYWWFTLAATILASGALFWDRMLGTTVVGALIILPLVIPILAVTVRRLHDTGRSGWWTLIGIVPLGQSAVIALTCLRSDPTDNAYGSLPPTRRARKNTSRPNRRPVKGPINSMNRRPPTKPRPRLKSHADSS